MHKLATFLEKAVADAPWVAKYKEQGRFGLPLDSDDPLIKLQRESQRHHHIRKKATRAGAECLLALHLILEHPPDATMAATEAAAALRASDFIEAERLNVLQAVTGFTKR